MPLNQTEWKDLQTQDRFAGHQAITGEQYKTPEQQAWWQGVQHVSDNADGTHGTLWGAVGEGDMPTYTSPAVDRSGYTAPNEVDILTDNGEDGIISNTDSIRNELGELADEFENQEQTTDLPEGNTYDTRADFLEE